ncbi:hypothetical protein ACFCZ1_33115 [Streptomyces sp. NPDC056224]|uniref:hypothetical protein n=1 Tax=Streptomyces sp. NPDC056224 TaxID=3345750 RepID=UPI0035E1ADE6
MPGASPSSRSASHRSKEGSLSSSKIPIFAIPAGWDWEIDHQQPGYCANGHLMPLTGTATVSEDLPNAPRGLLVLGS